MMFYEPSTVAHLMEWGTEPWRLGMSGQPRRHGWVSPCGYSVFVPVGDEYEAEQAAMVSMYGHPPALPTKPWCRNCASWARRRVGVLADCGILVPDVAPGTVVWS